jgi:cyclic-di-GMP phosphodiesterase, flagellum assembly factor TipF
MSKTLQFFYFLCYGLAALAIGFVAPRIFPQTPHAVAWLAGAVVFLAGALMHEIASRCYQASLDRHRLAVLHRAYTEAMEDIDRLAADLRALKRSGGYYGDAADLLTDEKPVSAQAGSFDLPAAAPPEPEPEPEPEPAAPEIDTGTADGKLLNHLVQRLYDARGGTTATVSGGLLEQETLNAVRDGLRKGDVDLYAQPIVRLPQRKPRHFDCEARLKSNGGDFMPIALYEEIVRASGLTVPVGDLRLFHTVRLAGAMPGLEPGGYVFCRIPPEVLSDRAFFQDFIAWLRDMGDLESRIVFEFREADVIDLDDAGADALGTLVDLGFHLCISQLHNFDVDAEQLVDGGVRFVKVDVEMLLPAMADETEFAHVRRFKSALDDVRLDLIVTGVANEQLLVELLDLDIEFGQGPLFGDPRKSSPTVTAAGTRQGRVG